MTNIIEEILKAAESEDTPQETKDAIREAFERGRADEVKKALNSDVEIHFVTKNGDISYIHVKGNGLAVNASLASLIYSVGMKVGEGKDGALKFIDKVCGAAKYAVTGNLWGDCLKT